MKRPEPKSRVLRHGPKPSREKYPEGDLDPRECITFPGPDVDGEGAGRGGGGAHTGVAPTKPNRSLKSELLPPREAKLSDRLRLAETPEKAVSESWED